MSLTYAFISLFFYGLWAFLPKMATKHLNTKSIIVYQIIGVVIFSCLIIYINKGKISFNVKGFWFAFGTGATGIIGTFFLLKALAKAKASIIVTITSLYPIIVILLAFIFLKETVTLRQGIGMGLALVAVSLISL